MSSSAPEPRIPDHAAVEAAERRIRDAVPESPLLRAHDLGDDLGQELWLKLESLQPTGSFKIRGATNWLRSASDEELRRGLITVSAGNHAQGVAWAAARAGVPVTVVMPAGSSPLKVRATRALGAEVIVEGDINEAVALTHRLCAERALTLVHPYDDPRVICGQGTVGLELLRRLPRLARVLCPIGGGGLISGIGIAVKSVRPDVQLIGVEPQGAATMRNAWDRGDAGARLERIDTIAASLAPAVVGRYTYAATRRYVDELVAVPEAAIADATRALLERGRVLAEPGAAVGIAALRSGAVAAAPAGATAAVITGGNIDPERLAGLFAAR